MLLYNDIFDISGSTKMIRWIHNSSKMDPLISPDQKNNWILPKMTWEVASNSASLEIQSSLLFLLVQILFVWAGTIVNHCWGWHFPF